MLSDDTDALTDVSRLSSLFAGYDRAYGMYSHQSTIMQELKAGKVEIKSTARTVRRDVTLELWSRHVSGDQPLGIIPIRSNNTCVWGCIDVDVYDVSLQDMVRMVEKWELPLVTCRTKSGGAHLFLFTTEPVPAEMMRIRLREIAALIGYGTSEVFPKQDTMALERGDMGNWLNMPYFGGDETDRYGVKSSGAAMTLFEFLEAADATKVTRAYLAETTFRKVTERSVNGHNRSDPSFGDGPPCLQHLTTEGFPQGTRNKGLFALGVLAKKKYGHNWQAMIETWNHDHISPPLPSGEVMQIIKSLEKKDYHYTCKDQPLAAHCNSTLCRSRRFGVGGDDDFPVIEGLSVMKTDPPLWFLDVDGTRMEFTTEQLLNYAEFRKLCLERKYVCYRQMRGDKWIEILSSAIKNAVEIDAPVEAGVAGHFMELVEEFLTDRHRAERKEEMLLGKPWLDDEAGRYYFRLGDLESRLKLSSFGHYNRPQIVARIRDLGGGKHFFNFNGKAANTWWLPTRLFEVSPPLALPRIDEEPL